MIRRFPLAMLALVVALFLVSVPATAKKGDPPDVVEDALAFATTDRSKAITLLENAISDAGRDKDIVTLHAGEQRRLAGDSSEAHAWFSALQERTRKGLEHDGSRLGLALLDAEDGVDGRVLSVLTDIGDRDALATQTAQKYLLLAIDAARRNDTSRVATYSKKALSFSRDDPEQASRIQDTLMAMADAAPGDIDSAIEGGRGGPLEKAEAAYLAGDLGEARKWAQKANVGDNAAGARDLLRVLDGASVDKNLIVALLPSGKYQSVGEQVREALVLGYGSAPARLEFVDSGATPDSAVAALEKAVLQDGAIAVLGPLLSDETDAVVAAAEALHVPLVSLSQSYEDTSKARWAMQAMYTRADQIEALLEHTMGAGGMTAFASFSPDNSFGIHALELFEAGVAARNGQIKTKATYSSEEKNLLPFAKELGVREGNLRALREQAEERGGNPDTVVLPPRVDFQAIFLPESANRTPLACAALAYEEFPMGDFVPTRDSPEIPLLGLNTWNTKTLVTTGNEYTRNSLFTDVFSSVVAGDGDPFMVEYRRATGRTPSALEAAMVDAGKLMAGAARANPVDRGSFRAALLEEQVTDSITGATGIDPETLRAKRTMLILTITRETLEKVAEIEL